MGTAVLAFLPGEPCLSGFQRPYETADAGGCWVVLLGVKSRCDPVLTPGSCQLLSLPMPPFLCVHHG